MSTATFTAPRKALLNAFRGVKNAVPTRGTALSRGVRLSINGTVYIQGGTVDHSARFLADWDRSGDAAICVDPQPIINALNGSKSETATVCVNGETVTVKTGAAELQWFCTAETHSTEFPSAARLFSIDVAELRQAIESTEYAADVESTRYALGGICVDMTRGCVQLVATDSRRLAAYETTVAVEGDDRNRHFVLPVKFWDTLSKLLPKSGTVEFFTIERPEPTTHDAPRSKTLYVAQCDGIRVESLPIEGRFPRWRDVVPNSCEYAATFDARDMLSACKAVLPGTDEEHRGCDFTVAENPLSGDRLHIKAQSAVAFCPAKFTGSATHGSVITFDPRFFRDMMESVRGSVEMRLTDHQSPAVLVAGSLTYVVMPLCRDR